MLEFKIGEQSIYFEDKDVQEEKKVSKHTDKELCNYEIEVRLEGEENRDWFENKLDNTWYKIDDNEVIGEYNSKMISSSFSDQSDIYNYRIKLTEKEILKIDKLIVGELEIEPYQYDERYDKLEQDDEALIINGKSEAIYDDFLEQYLSKEKYFNVVRQGINEQTINMRFGKVTWSRIEDTEKIKIDFTLVEKNYDINSNNSSLFNPEFNNMMWETAYKSKLLDELIEYLIS